MDSFALAVIATYLYATYLIVLRAKISHQSIRVFKILLPVLFALDILLFVQNPGSGFEMVTGLVVMVPILYMLGATYLNEVRTVIKKLKFLHKKKSGDKIDNDLADILMETLEFLSNRKIGALITVERNDNLSAFISKALMINAPVSSELLASIFIPTTPLHDGAVIIRDGSILCAKAYYPSTERTDLPLHFGTRHRAAIGISEQSDSLTLVVSEETGYVSVAINRQLDYNVSKETMSLYFEKYLKMK
ncbi:MAG: diadenylate cyclase [Candidatus Izemoplasmatales bacterium]